MLLWHGHRMSVQEGVFRSVQECRACISPFSQTPIWWLLDESRTQQGFDLTQCCSLLQVIKAGATTVNIPDTTGWALPHEFGNLIAELRKNTEGAESVIFSAHCQNDLGLASANTLAAAEAGARQLECTINGIGERAGNTSLEEIVMAIALRG